MHCHFVDIVDDVLKDVPIDVDTKNNWVVKDDDGKEVSINWTNVETKVKEIEAENEAAEKVRDDGGRVEEDGSELDSDDVGRGGAG